MGIFKDMRTLSKQGKALSANTDVGARLAEGSAAMAQANQFLVEQTAGARIATTGLPARFQVTAARDTGTVVNMQPVVEIDLLVSADGRVPYPTTVRQTVPLASTGRLVPGAVLSGRVDPVEAATIWVDWTT